MVPNLIKLNEQNSAGEIVLHSNVSTIKVKPTMQSDRILLALLEFLDLNLPTALSNLTPMRLS